MDFFSQAQLLLRKVVNGALGNELPIRHWSGESLDVLAGLLIGKELKKTELERLQDKESIIHLVYFYYLRRFADAGALAKLVERTHMDLISGLPHGLQRSDEYRRLGRLQILPEVEPASDGYRVLVDVSNTISTGARTGIQRVVRELCTCLGSASVYRFMASQPESGRFVEVSSIAGELILQEDAVPVTFRCGDVYLDLDGSWGDQISRWPLYVGLRQRGLRIAHVHYDAVPVLFPHLSHATTVIRYLEHFMAMLTFSDRIFCISNAVRTALLELSSEVGARSPPAQVIPLGSVLNSSTRGSELVTPEVAEFCSRGRYVLCVGTVEPRKNYGYLLQRIDEIERLGLNVIIVGKRGWEIEEIIQRLGSYREIERDSHVLWLDQANDDVLRYVYRHCFVYLTVALYEGYGLPVIEALSYGCAVVCSDGGALAEVGKGCVLSFSLEQPEQLRSILEQLSSDEQAYAALKARAANFVEARWEETSATINADLERFLLAGGAVQSADLQRVYISISAEKLRHSLESSLKFGRPRSLVVLTAVRFESEFRAMLADVGIPATVLLDEELLPELGLPEDHQARNFLLRRALYASPHVDQVFVASDDDSLQLRSLPGDYYVEGGRFIGHYFNSSMARWKASSFGVSSYDQGQWTTAEVLLAHGFGDLAFSSHQPQIIEKQIACEIFEEYGGMTAEATFDEWSLYFNVAVTRYSNRLMAEPTTTLRWPSDFSSWVPDWFIEDIYFENFYPDNYSAPMDGKAGSETLGMDYRIKILEAAGNYDKYHVQSLLAEVSGLMPKLRILGDDRAELTDVGLSGISGCWLKVPVDQGAGSFGYTVSSRGKLIVDGRCDVQQVDARADLAIQLPDVPGKYELYIAGCDGEVRGTNVDLFVMPWRGIVKS